MHHDPTLLLELGIVVFGLGLLARLANKISLSPIPLYLIAGLGFGTGGFLPLEQAGDFIGVSAQIGVVLLLLLLGLEYTADELFTNLRSSALGGLVDFVLNFTPGFIVGLILGWSPVTAGVLGGVVYVSSSGVIAKTLSDLGRLGNRETPTILSILVLEDLAMALYLPVITGLLIGGSVGTVLKLVTLAIITVVAILFVALRYGRYISRAINSENSEVLLLLILGLSLIIGGFAEKLHVSAGVGAFLVGIALSGQVAHGAREILSPLRDLFAAVFFVYFGLQTDPSKIPDVFFIALGLVIVTGATKITTGWFVAKRAGLGKRGRMRAGVSLIARGEFSIVIAGFAVAQGVEPELAPLAATYVMMMAILGPILARWEGGRPKWLKKAPA